MDKNEEEEFSAQQNLCAERIAEFARKEEECMSGLAGLSPEDVAARKVDACNFMLAQASLHIIVSNLRNVSRGNKNENALEDARKCVVKVISTLEEIVSAQMDIPFSEAAEKAAVLTQVDLKKRISLMQKTGVTLDLIAQEYGDNPRLKWSLVDPCGRFAAVSKNFVDVAKLIKSSFDMRDESCEDCRQYIQVMKVALQKAVDSYSDRFDFSSRAPDDLRVASNCALVYSRILAASGATGEAQDMKKRADFLKDKFEANLKAKKEEKK